MALPVRCEKNKGAAGISCGSGLSNGERMAVETESLQEEQAAQTSHKFPWRTVAGISWLWGESPKQKEMP